MTTNPNTLLLWGVLTKRVVPGQMIVFSGTIQEHNRFRDLCSWVILTQRMNQKAVEFMVANGVTVQMIQLAED